MRIAILDSVRSLPSPRTSAFCPRCGEPVIARCGQIKAWHWAHRAGTCASYLLPETEWTAMWKDKFPLSSQEVFHEGEIFDILHNSTALLLAPAALTEEQILARDYAPLRWIIDGRQQRIDLTPDNNIVRFTWKRASPGWLKTKAKIFIDLGPRILFVKKMRLYKTTIYGWGYYNPHATFHLTIPESL